MRTYRIQFSIYNTKEKTEKNVEFQKKFKSMQFCGVSLNISYRSFYLLKRHDVNESGYFSTD